MSLTLQNIKYMSLDYKICPARQNTSCCCDPESLRFLGKDATEESFSKGKKPPWPWFFTFDMGGFELYALEYPPPEYTGSPGWSDGKPLLLFATMSGELFRLFVPAENGNRLEIKWAPEVGWQKSCDRSRPVLKCS